MTEYHILNLGAGVQSTTLYLLSMEGRIPRFDAAIFADTQDETKATYKHLEWLKSLNGPPILVRSKGRLSADLIRGQNSTGGRFGCSIPAFVKLDGDRGQVRRQCTKEYKIVVIERAIRREVVGLAPGRRLPNGVSVVQYIGVSWDERTRADDIEFSRFRDRRGWVVRFPLLTMNGEMQAGWTRQYCESDYLPKRVPHVVPRSACKECPFRTDSTWLDIKAQPDEWADVVQIDRALREPGRIVNRDLDGTLYLHGSCKPIDEIEFRNEHQLGFVLECEGGCGL